MDQKRIGSFLKELRKEKGITQEQVAEKLNVSARTVSRWETGRNMPDISLLVEIAELFDVTIPEIINGERKDETMNEEVKEVARKMADYAETEKETILKNTRIQSVIGVCALFVLLVLEMFGQKTNEFVENMQLYCETLIKVTIIMILLNSTGLLYRLRGRKTEDSLPISVKILKAIVCAVIGAVCAYLILNLFKFGATRLFGL